MALVFSLSTTFAVSHNLQESELYGAAMNGDLEKVKALLAVNSEDINRVLKNPRSTILHDLITWGHIESGLFGGNKNLEIIKAFILAGADVNTQSDGGYTPLYRSIILRDFPVFQLLLSFGADVNVVDCKGETVLHCVRYRNLFIGFNDYHEIIKLLINAGANVQMKNNKGDTPLHHIIKNLKKYSGNTGPFAYLNCKFKGVPECVELLLNAGADINAVNKKGESPLSCAQSIKHVEKRERMVNLLLKNGAKEKNA